MDGMLAIQTMRNQTLGIKSVQNLIRVLKKVSKENLTYGLVSCCENYDFVELA